LELTDTHQLFCIYLTNLTPAGLRGMLDGLSNFTPFVGYSMTTTSSPMKDWLSVVVGPALIKSRHRMIGMHEDDVPNDENVDYLMWPLRENRYELVTLQEIYYNLFLSYKIERAPFVEIERDGMYGLMAISDLPLPLQELGVLIEEPKLQYLRENKYGSLETSGITEYGVYDLQALIASKINDSYIYNLRFKPQSDASLFNIIIEVLNPTREDAVRLMVGLEYQPKDRLVRLTTLF
jgi:hypothetical protein